MLATDIVWYSANVLQQVSVLVRTILILHMAGWKAPTEHSTRNLHRTTRSRVLKDRSSQVFTNVIHCCIRHRSSILFQNSLLKKINWVQIWEAQLIPVIDQISGTHSTLNTTVLFQATISVSFFLDLQTKPTTCSC